MIDDHFARWFRHQLRLREWSQADFSRRSRITPSTVNAWYLAKRRPDTESCDLIADAFGLPLDEVLRVTRHRPGEERSSDDEYKDRLKGLIDGIPVEMLGPVPPMLQGLHDSAQKTRLRVIEGRRERLER